MVVLIILLGLFFRIWNLEYFAGFSYDQEVAAFWIRDFIINHKLSLIGQEISVGGVFIGPFFYYLMAPFYWLSNLYPLGGNIFMVAVSLLNMVMIYLFAKQIFSRSCALIALFLYSVHPGIITFDRTVAPSGMIILLSTTTAFILNKTRRASRDYLILGIILGLTFSVHPTVVLLIPITALYFLVKKRKIKNQRVISNSCPNNNFILSTNTFRPSSPRSYC
jgi:4-amino-4-deoxy-L-arabinose transferase-like glycosyltransferase